MASTPRARICDLPNEVLVTIFSLLPVADLAWCAATCEQWRAIVTRFTVLWKGKTYRTYRSPDKCAETRAVLHALPPLREVVIESANGFSMNISYLRIVLSQQYVRVLQDCPRLKCTFLRTRVNIAGDILSKRSIIDFEGLQHLRILQASKTGFWAPHEYSAAYVVQTALSLCPNLRYLSVYTDSISEENIDVVEGLGQLKSLEMSCTGLQKLSFLRHCSKTLEELQLLCCTSLPSRELTELRQLRGLRRLRLSYCVFQEGGLEAAMMGLGKLERLQLDCCSSVRDLSSLQHCGELTELHITSSYMPAPLMMVAPEGLNLHNLRPPTNVDFRLGRVVGVTVTAVDLRTALSQLEELGLASCCLAYLGTLRNCSRLRHLICEFLQPLEETELLNVRVHISLTSSSQS